MRRHDIIGKRFGALVVIEDEFERFPSKSGRSFNYRVKVRCDCGTEKLVVKHSLGRSKSCGCMKADLISQSSKTHGMSRTRIYVSLFKLFNQGLVCRRWQSVEKFFDDTGAGRDQLVERVDKTKKLSPRNYRIKDGVGRLITINGQTKNLKDWAEVLGVTRERARQLANSGSLRDRVAGV